MGVERAVKLAESAVRNGQGQSNPDKADGNVWTIGGLVHNPQVVNRLEELGVKVAGKGLPEAQPGTKVVIAAYGANTEVYEQAREKQYEVVDATCPYVRMAQVKAKDYVAEGFQVIIFGDRGHTEVDGEVSWSGGKAVVISSLEELDKLKLGRKIALLVQTTQKHGVYLAIAKRLMELALHEAKEIRICNTICNATTERQEAAINLCDKVDAVVVVGGKTSANTKRLVEICRGHKLTYHIENTAEIDKDWFAGVKRVGLTAGASTPDWVIEDVKSALQKIEPK